VKLKRRPPCTTLATRLMATTRSMYAVFSALPSRRLSRRSRRSLCGPPPRRCGPAMIPSLLRTRLQRQSTVAGTVSHRGHPAVVVVARAVEDSTFDACGTRPLGYELADLARFGGLVAVHVAQVGQIGRASCREI